MSDNKPFHKRKFPLPLTVGDIAELKTIAQDKQLDSARFNYHESDEAPLHKMLIYMPKTLKERIHVHNDKDEIILIEEGEIAINIYDEELNLKETRTLTPSENKSFIISKGTIHSVNITSATGVFIEIAQGPFRPDMTKWYTR
jgi:cupin fold WbuC family metalloprotein